ncbi:Variable major outer membrane lipoprotein (plasmid) [Borrelia crocidurae DOU]|uniref:Variable major outer membrane lipoprotein n=1 Tax=Borrelia crocidurae DOU TaxID=1293575 RepID=W5SLW2_9SPIR|nr:Variable major outer membrane lipoprotein [Borrelia crocidurae DOU]
MLVMSVVMGCDNGGLKEGGASGGEGSKGVSLSSVLMEVGRSAENVFYSFILSWYQVA